MGYISEIIRSLQVLKTGQLSKFYLLLVLVLLLCVTPPCYMREQIVKIKGLGIGD